MATVLLTAILATLVFACARAGPPHIFFLLVDDLGYANVGFTGTAPPSREVQTPNLDALAASGAILTRNYVSPPRLASDSRHAKSAGPYPISSMHPNNLTGPQILQPDALVDPDGARADPRQRAQQRRDAAQRRRSRWRVRGRAAQYDGHCDQTEVCWV